MPPPTITVFGFLTLIVSSSLLVSGCRSAGRFLGDLLKERPPAPLDSMSVASDVRIDSLGFVMGSFVGEGTSRAVHLLSSDTGLVIGLARRYRPDLLQAGEIWQRLARAQTVALAPGGRRRTVAEAPKFDRALVGSPLGQTAVTPTAVLLHGSQCGWRGAQVEIIVDREPGDRDPPLRGPVLASFTRSATPGGNPERDGGEFRRRTPVPSPSPELADELIRRTSMAMDSVLDASFRSLELRRPDDLLLEVNTLSDIDAADLTSYRVRPNAVRFAVSLRERRITGGRDTVLAATVMAWDSAGAWQQFIFRPTVLSFRKGRLGPYGALRRSIFWRRLQPISDFGFERDNLWMEQVDVRADGVLWGIVQPRGNVVVAAAEVDGPCR
ncbi:MAG TPA: hypothetical protein VFU40_01985 [Gemmatimonadales bacterium]|nr:hypothetical protein [Gemmatimonadales bacterium]